MHQRMNSRGAEENYKAAASRLRKIATVPREQNPVTPSHERAKRLSNGSFETTHRPPAAFPGSLSFTEGRRTNPILREKSRENALLAPKRGVVVATRCRGAATLLPIRENTTQRRGYTINIGLEDGSRCFRSGRPVKSRTFEGSSGLAWHFRVRFLLARSHRCSMRQTPLLQPLPLSLRRIASYGWLADETDA